MVAYSAPMPPKGKENQPRTSVRVPRTPGQTIRIEPCKCTDDTPVQDLCHLCEKKRRRILDRARRRRKRGGAEGGGTQLSAIETGRLLTILDAINNRQVALEDRARLTGRPLSPDVTDLLTQLALLRHTLRPALAARGEEAAELDRPGGSPRVGTTRSTT